MWGRKTDAPGNSDPRVRAIFVFGAQVYISLMVWAHPLRTINLQVGMSGKSNNKSSLEGT